MARPLTRVLFGLVLLFVFAAYVSGSTAFWYGATLLGGLLLIALAEPFWLYTGRLKKALALVGAGAFVIVSVVAGFEAAGLLALFVVSLCIVLRPLRR